MPPVHLDLFDARVAGRDTGIGTQFLVKDITGNGLLDIVLSNKTGVNVLIQRRQRNKPKTASPKPPASSRAVDLNVE